MKVEKKGITKDISDSLVKDYLAAGWKEVKGKSENKKEPRINLQENNRYGRV